jgi:predicted ATPase with chaperone activity
MSKLKGELGKILSPIMDVDGLGIPIGLIQDTIFRILFNEGEADVARLAQLLGLHARLLDQMLSQMKQEHLVEITRTGALGSLSFTYSLTDAGTKRARDAFERSQYIGRMPVSLESYNSALLLQTETTHQITPAKVREAISHLILPENFHRRIGPAVNAGSSLFLYGPPGNGKTTISEAIAAMLASGHPIWLPESITVGGQIVRIFDPLVHIALPEEKVAEHLAAMSEESATRKIQIDNRWRLFERPAVMVGGELRMEALELRYSPTSKLYEAPLQLKANGGMFLIDDFGRQQLSPQELLNRWIVPLESGIDFLRLQSGQSLEVPFRQLIVFSTNLDPNELVDGAFLRRIQMKVEVGGPDERMFFQIFQKICQDYEVPFDKKSFVHLLQKWYREPKRVMQSVHPRDVVKTIVSICDYEGITPHMTPELIDEACISYFVNSQ